MAKNWNKFGIIALLGDAKYMQFLMFNFLILNHDAKPFQVKKCSFRKCCLFRMCYAK